MLIPAPRLLVLMTGLSTACLVAAQQPTAGGQAAAPAARYQAPAPYASTVQSQQGQAPAQPSAAAIAVASGRDQGLPAGRPSPMPTPLPEPISRVQQALEQVAPLEPAEVSDLMGKLYERQRAAGQNVTGQRPAKPITSAETLDLSPGATPPVLRIAIGQGSVISFVDAAGRPWEIVDDLNFNDRAYSVRLLGPHLYAITLKSRETAHVTVVLKGLPRPISITAVPATQETDYIKEFMVPRFIDGQPPASVASSAQEGALAFNAPELLNFLYRTPPKGARQLSVSGLPDVTAWQTGPTKMVVRTGGQVVIPAFSRRHGSSDGAAVFEVPLTPVVSITQGGVMHRVQVSGFVVESTASTLGGR